MYRLFGEQPSGSRTLSDPGIDLLLFGSVSGLVIYGLGAPGDQIEAVGIGLLLLALGVSLVGPWIEALLGNLWLHRELRRVRGVHRSRTSRRRRRWIGYEEREELLFIRVTPPDRDAWRERRPRARDCL